MVSFIYSKGKFAGRASPQDDGALLGEWNAGGARTGDDAGDGHRGGALDVVVEGGDDLAVLVEQEEGVALLEVLPLQERPGEAIPHGAHELVHERVVLLATQARAAP